MPEVGERWIFAGLVLMWVGLLAEMWLVIDNQSIRWGMFTIAAASTVSVIARLIWDRRHRNRA